MKFVALMSPDNTVKNVIVLPEERIADFENSVRELGITDTPLLCDLNSYRGKNRDGSSGPVFRKNYPKTGYIYDPVSDAFLEPKPVEYPSWILDADGGFWRPPVPPPGVLPEAGKKYVWDEATVSWIQVAR